MFIAAVGDPRRFLTSRKLVAYLGLDPKVRQSGDAPARSGRISKRGSAAARWALVEAAWSVVLQPGPLHAFYDRTRARRGHGKAIVATARRLAILFWCMLTRGEDYAHQQPSLTAQELRGLEIAAGAPVRQGQAVRRVGHSPEDARCRNAACRAGPGVLRADGPRLEGRVAEEERGRERDSGARIDQALEGQHRAAGPRAPDSCTLTRHRLAPNRQPSAADRRRRPRRRPRARKIRPATMPIAAAPAEPASQQPF